MHMLVHNEHLFFTMHDMDVKVKMGNTYFKKFMLGKQVIKGSSNGE